MKVDRHPDFYVLVNRPVPAFIQGEYRNGLLVAFQLGKSPFLIHPIERRLYSFCGGGTALDIKIAPAEPVTDVWDYFATEVGDPSEYQQDPSDGSYSGQLNRPTD